VNTLNVYGSESKAMSVMKYDIKAVAL